MKDKYGFKIPDKFNKMRKSTENKSGTWRDDEYEQCMYDIIDLIEKRYPDHLKKQKSLFITLPSAFAMHLTEKEIEKHEQGKIPHYMMVGSHLVDLFEGMDVTKRALVNQMKEIMGYLENHPQLREDEIVDRLK